MSTVEKTLFTIKCDTCHQVFEDEDEGFVAWTDPNSAREIASASGWKTSAVDDDLCPDCYEQLFLDAS